MKNSHTILSIFILLLGFTLSAQESDTTKIRLGSKVLTLIEDENQKVTVSIEPDSTEVNVDAEIPDMDMDMEITDLDSSEKHEPKSKSKNEEFDGHWHGFQTGVNFLVNSDMKTPGSGEGIEIDPFRSWSFGLNLIQFDYPLIGERFGVLTGLGFTWKNYGFENDVTLISGENTVEFLDVNDARKYTKNQIRGSYLTIPVAFEYQVPVGKRGHKLFLQAGAYGNIKLGQNYREEWEENDKEFETKSDTDYYMQAFEYGLTARVGYHNLNLFANYSLTPIFKNMTQEYTPLTVGVMIVGF